MSKAMKSIGNSLSFEPKMTDFYNANAHAIGQVQEACMTATLELFKNNSFKFQDGEFGCMQEDFKLQNDHIEFIETQLADALKSIDVLKAHQTISKALIDQLKTENMEMSNEIDEFNGSDELDFDLNDYSE
jgi:hypothetical protein